jgi:uncharacterized protein with GYD domain
MTTFVLLTKISSMSVTKMTELAELDKIFDEQLSKELPQVTRIASYALLGLYDFLHIFEAPDAITAAKVSLIANRFGAGTTQTLTAIPFEDFKKAAKEVNRIHITRR